MGSLNRDPNEIREFIENIDPNQNSISFEDFIQLMQNVENRIVQNSGPNDQNRDEQQLQHHVASKGGLVSI